MLLMICSYACIIQVLVWRWGESHRRETYCRRGMHDSIWHTFMMTRETVCMCLYPVLLFLVEFISWLCTVDCMEFLSLFVCRHMSSPNFDSYLWQRLRVIRSEFSLLLTPIMVIISANFSCDIWNVQRNNYGREKLCDPSWETMVKLGF
jgi:hypothetical protein